MIFPGVGWLFSKLKWLIMQSGEQGAQTTVYCAVADETAHQTGLYYSNCQIAETPTATKSEVMANLLWLKSLEMTHFEKNTNLFTPA
ncbi:hypothetical protein J6590_023309 [Homalodisca vitripennis]|nr:hypothetical protein J6590_023309 [Homalodisca vitripennis]